MQKPTINRHHSLQIFHLIIFHFLCSAHFLSLDKDAQAEHLEHIAHLSAELLEG